MSGANEIRIGDLSTLTQASVRSLRYYEQQGLLAAHRTASGQRVYPPEAAERVRYIQHLIAAGLGTRTIRELIPCFDSGLAHEGMLDRLVEEREKIGARIAELTEMHGALDRIISTTEHYVPAEDSAVA